MADNLIYWLWLQDCLGAGAKVKHIFEQYSDAKEFYFAGEAVWKKNTLKAAAFKKMQTKNPEQYTKIVNLCNEHKIYILCPDDKYYPQKLFDIENYPLALYVRGDYKLLQNEKSIAVIGSRTPCVYGQKAAEKIVNTLAKSNYVIVSGGALGIDSVAHNTTIASGGRTVLVMGCGHGNGYLSENSSLRKQVAGNGALVTEYPPRHPVTHSSFPLRNRLISALSKGVVIVEAADPSGTFNTANHALDQNRDVFVLPGDIESGNFDGSNRLITEGANPVFSGEDILVFYGDAECTQRKHTEKNGTAFNQIDIDSEFSKKNRKKSSKRKTKKEASVSKEVTLFEPKAEKKEKNCPEGISKNAAIVYNIMSTDILLVDDIARKSGLDIRKVLVALTELEMLGVAQSDGPGKYQLK